MHKKIYLFIIISLLSMVNSSSAQAKELSSHFARAKELYRMGRWIDARHELLKAKDEVGRGNHIYNQEIDFYSTLCYVGLEEGLILKRLDYFESLYPESIFANQITFNRGLTLSSLEDNSAARAELQRVDYSKLSHHEKEEYDIRMGYIAFLDGDYALSKQHFGRIPTHSEYYIHALYYSSYIDYANNDLISAKEGFIKLTSSDAYGSVAPFYLLQIEFQQGNYDYVIARGLDLMKSAIAAQKNEIARTVAEAHFRKGDFEGAIKHITLYENSGVKMSREDNYILGFSLYRIARYEAAQQYLKRASGADDELTQNASYHLADCCLRNGNKSGAMQAFAMASNDSFDSVIAEDALFNYGKLQYELGGGMFNEAINVLTRYIDKYPTSPRTPEAKKLLAAAYYNSKSYDAAYKAIIEIKNPDADIKSALQKITYFKALESMNMGDNDLAKRLLKESEKLAVSPKYTALSIFWQGEISYIEGDYKTALKNFNTYLSRAPKGDNTYIMAQYSTAYALLDDKNENSALIYLKRFTQLSPNDSDLRADAYNRMGDIMYGKRQFVEASRNYTFASESASEGQHYAKFQNATIAGIMGSIQRKIAILKEIIADGKGQYVDVAAYELGRTYMTQERYEDAVVSLEEFVERYPNSPKYPQALSDLGLSHLNLGDKLKSISYYDRAIKAAPQSVVSKDALQGIREIYINKGDAKGYFEYAENIGVESDLGAVERDSLSFASAQKMYFAGSGRATKSLESYVNDYPQGYYLTDALFLLSDCYLKDGEDSEAIESLTKLLSSGANQYTQKVLERLSKLTYKSGDYDQSASAYRKLYDIVKSDTEKASAMDGYVASIIATNDREKVLEMADDVISQPKSGAKAMVKAKYAKATILRENGEWSEAIKLYSDLNKNPQSAIGAESTYYLISNAHRAGDIEGAEKMIFAFSESQTTQAYWLAKAFIILGDIYVVRGDNFQARATYQSIVDGYALANDGVVEEAKLKIEKLKDNE